MTKNEAAEAQAIHARLRREAEQAEQAHQTFAGTAADRLRQSVRDLGDYFWFTRKRD